MGRPRLQTRQPETQRRHSAAIGRIASALGLIEIKSREWCQPPRLR